MKRILVIDDEFPIVDALTVLLEDEGYLVKSAQDGLAGLKLVATFAPHLVICDVMMPVMGGFEFLRNLRRMPAGSTIPVIFMSAVHSIMPIGDPNVSMFGKPFQIDDLLYAIAGSLSV